VTFSGNQPEMMRLEDALGQQTAIQFLDVTLNGKVDASRFSFVAPEGADVIRQSE
jgi:outer membrane lipoprotein carrier protein